MLTDAVKLAAAEMGRRGGTATGKARTPKERKEAASKAAKARWKGHKKKGKP